LFPILHGNFYPSYERTDIRLLIQTSLFGTMKWCKGIVNCRRSSFKRIPFASIYTPVSVFIGKEVRATCFCHRIFMHMPQCHTQGSVSFRIDAPWLSVESIVSTSIAVRVVQKTEHNFQSLHVFKHFG